MIQEGSPTLTLSHVNFGDVQILRHNPRDMSGVMGSSYAIHPVRMNQVKPVVFIETSEGQTETRKHALTNIQSTPQLGAIV